MPRMLDAVNKRPRVVDLVAARKQSCVSRHRVEKESFVGLRTGFAEAGPVLEIHLYRFNRKLRSWPLRVQNQGEDRGGLD